MRRFTGGIVLVNPSDSDDGGIDLGGAYLDPTTGSTFTKLDMKAKTGAILLKVMSGPFNDHVSRFNTAAVCFAAVQSAAEGKTVTPEGL